MYEFTHGIDHIGDHGFTPILLLGKEVCDRDFAERDLSAIQGVHISHRGLDREVKWQDLNIELLGIKFPNLRYLHIEFGDQCDVSGFGPQPMVEVLTLICPKLRQKSDIAQFQNARRSKIQIPSRYLDKLVSQKIESIELIRPKFSSLEELPVRQKLTELRVVYARNLLSLCGLEKFPSLSRAVFTDCPNLVKIGSQLEDSSICEILLSGVRSLKDIDSLSKAKFLKIATVIEASKQLVVPESIQTIFRDRV